ncbi:DsbA family protein [Barrientosiimonas humi]|uniref:DsbA family oxidoreductase n=1 Tax=Barrientosiimonas humi TaxID=999931 RepID=UPI00370D0DBF
MADTSLNLYVDVMCAHSYLAYPGLRAALSDRRAAGHRVTLHIHPLLIAPDAPTNASEPLPDVHRRLFGPSSRSNEQAMTQRATAAGIPLHYERAQFTSTIPALSAILQAQDRDPVLGEELLAGLFRAYFADGAVISDLGWLTSFCGDYGVAGLDFSTEQLDRVREASQNARSNGINSAPTLQLPSGDLIVGGREQQEYSALIGHGGSTSIAKTQG